MQKRSLPSVILLSAVTLGLYDLYWLSKTRNEMVAKFQANIPPAIYLILTRVAQFIGLAAVVFIVYHAIPTNSQRINDALQHKPPAECYGRYNLDAACKKAIDGYYVTDNSTTLVFVILAIIALMAVLYWYYIVRWIQPYAVTAEKITGGNVHADVIILLYGLLSPLIGTLLIQRAFNKGIRSLDYPPPGREPNEPIDISQR